MSARGPALLLLVAASAGCAAPPLGFGSGARIPAPAGSAIVEGRSSLALGPGRQTYQADASTVVRVRRWFAPEVGAVFTHTRQDVDGGGTLVLNGGFPFARPRFFVGNVSLAIGLAGLGMGGGGGGIVGGVADAELGYGTDTWSVYAGAQRHYFELTAEDAVRASSRQLRAGGQYTVRAGTSRLGVALEVHRQDDELRNDPLAQATRFWAVAVELSYTSPAFR